MIALGDAVAVAFTRTLRSDCRSIPRLASGREVWSETRKVSDLMVKGNDLPLVSPSTLMSDALITLSEKNLGSVVVIDDAGALLGIVTDGDLKRHIN